MQNRPFKVIDPDTNKEIVIWQSRSCAVVGFVFCKDSLNNWCVLANKRGIGTPDYQGYWNCPCGYLDYNENANEAIVREVWEETGLNVSDYKFFNFNTNTEVNSNLQNVTLRHYCVLPCTTDVWSDFSIENMEDNEVEDITWIRISDISNYKWAFGHKELIQEVYYKYINIPWYKKLIKWLYNKNFK